MPSVPKKQLDFTPVSVPAMALVEGAALRREILDLSFAYGLPEQGTIVEIECCVVAGANNQHIVFCAKVRRGKKTSREAFLFRRQQKKFFRLNFNGLFAQVFRTITREPELVLAADKVHLEIILRDTAGVVYKKVWQVPAV